MHDAARLGQPVQRRTLIPGASQMAQHNSPDRIPGKSRYGVSL
jgi:hypothetical protein